MLQETPPTAGSAAVVRTGRLRKEPGRICAHESAQ
jgi:hypothetical protein